MACQREDHASGDGSKYLKLGGETLGRLDVLTEPPGLSLRSKDSKLLKAMRATIDTLMDDNANYKIAYDLKQAQFDRACERQQTLIDVIDKLQAMKETYETKNKQEGVAIGVCEGCSNAKQTELGRVRSADGDQSADDGQEKPATQGDAQCDRA